jgi:hypothetical protein
MMNEPQTQIKEELTLLALGKEYALVGDAYGLVRRICSKCLENKTTKTPRRVYIEDEKTQDLYGFPVLLSEDVPRDTIIAPQKVVDKFSGLAVNAAFAVDGGAWYVMEIADPFTGAPSG